MRDWEPNNTLHISAISRSKEKWNNAQRVEADIFQIIECGIYLITERGFWELGWASTSDTRAGTVIRRWRWGHVGIYSALLSANWENKYARKIRKKSGLKLMREEVGGRIGFIITTKDRKWLMDNVPRNLTGIESIYFRDIRRVLLMSSTNFGKKNERIQSNRG